MSGDHKPGNVKVGTILFTVRGFHKHTKLALLPTLYCHKIAVLCASYDFSNCEFRCQWMLGLYFKVTDFIHPVHFSGYG